MTRTLILAGLAAVSLLIPSCFPILGCPSSVKSLVQTTTEELKMVKKEADNAIMLTVRKVKDDEVDPDIGKEIIYNLKGIIKYADSLLTVCAHLDSVGRREEIHRFRELAGASIQNKRKTLNCLNDLYNISTNYQFETDSYFPEGIYGIPPNIRDEANKLIGPIVQDIIKFLNDHPGQRFVTVITCYGFTDETPVKTELISEMTAKVCTRGRLTRQELNIRLSKLRAKSIMNQMVDQIKSYEKFISDPKLVSYDMIWLGKGEELPYPDKIKDYKPLDKRRRLAHLIWHVLPGSLYRFGSSE